MLHFVRDRWPYSHFMQSAPPAALAEIGQSVRPSAVKESEHEWEKTMLFFVLKK